MRILTTIAIILISISVFGQTTSDINLKEPYSKNLYKNLVDIDDNTYLYINDGTSTQLFYYALDQTAMINQLRISGNENAEFISALGKGYRLNGMRHPHSWSVAEPNELMDWIIEKMK